MLENFRGSKTEQNLINAFAGEAQTRNKYTYYSKIEKKEGYEKISEIFSITAENELEHAKLFFNHIKNLPIGHVDGFYSFEMGTTEENLAYAIAGETQEYNVLYLDGEMTAKEEGFEQIANTFRNIRTIEEHHAKRYKELLTNLEKGTLFDKEEETLWICRKCGYIYRGKSAPEHCPNCFHPKGYFEILCEKY
jgi:rubrerythrin